MGKNLFIAEKPSVAKEFAKALKLNTKSFDGYLESENCIVTWCVGHLVSMSYPEVYDPALKRWSLETIPFIPEEYRYEVIPSVKKQYEIVSRLLNREDVSVIYVCTDSGREGEYIYRLVERQANVQGKERRRVWIDSQTEEEIKRGIKEAKDLSEYDNLCEAAFLRAKEDYLMGINFSRALTLKFGYPVKQFLNADKGVVAVGRVMTCVQGMVVNREREIRNFVKTAFYRVMGQFSFEKNTIEAEWKSQETSEYFESPLLYKENGFKKREDAENLIQKLSKNPATVGNLTKKKEVRMAPLLYNLAELQNDCSKYFKISPDQTLQLIQEMYEKKLLTYPRTDARVLSTAVSKEIYKNLNGLSAYSFATDTVKEILESGSYKGIAKTKYCNDKLITDHYAIIPTGQGLSNLNSLSDTAKKVYEIVVRRFLAIFLPPAEYQKISLEIHVANGEHTEKLFSNFKVLSKQGFLSCMTYSFAKKKDANEEKEEKDKSSSENKDGELELACDEGFFEVVNKLKKGDVLGDAAYSVKEGETSPPKRYNSGSIILAMENAGQLIEDEELRAQIKGSGIGTSATRAEILKKLVNNNYLNLNKKTQIITPTLLGEMIYEVVACSIKSLLDPSLTASWEKGLTGVADGTIAASEYMEKLDGFVRRRVDVVKRIENVNGLNPLFRELKQYYK